MSSSINQMLKRLKQSL